jgi:hypothetical protein
MNPNACGGFKICQCLSQMGISADDGNSRIVSPQSASIVGPGNCPFTTVMLVRYPSGAITAFEIVKSY